MKTKILLKKLANFYPKRISEKYHDPVGLQTGTLKEETKTILLCLDFDEMVFDIMEKENLFSKVDLIITHHPFIFGTKYKVFKYNEFKKILCDKIDSYNIPIYSYHTNFDEGKCGMNDALAEKLELGNIKPLEGDPMARGGDLKEAMNINDFSSYCLEKLNIRYGHLINEGTQTIKKVAIVGGGGWSTYRIAQKENYDIFISGDIPHHARRDIISLKYNYLDIPHEVEKIFVNKMKETLLKIDSSLNIISIDHEIEPSIVINNILVEK